MENKTIFREKSIDRISSPEQLNDYIKVTTPSVWLVLIAILLLLAGAMVWGICGEIRIHTDSGVETVAPIEYLIR